MFNFYSFLRYIIISGTYKMNHLGYNVFGSRCFNGLYNDIVNCFYRNDNNKNTF